MHTPENHPNLNPNLSGCGRRYVRRTEIKRHMRLDAGSDRCLVFVQGQLANPDNPQDSVSVSMIARRALRLYEKHIDRLRLDPSALYNERLTVRDMSQMPGRRRRATARSSEALRASKAVLN